MWVGGRFGFRGYRVGERREGEEERGWKEREREEERKKVGVEGKG